MNPDVFRKFISDSFSISKKKVQQSYETQVGYFEGVAGSSKNRFGEAVLLSSERSMLLSQLSVHKTLKSLGHIALHLEWLVAYGDRLFSAQQSMNGNKRQYFQMSGLARTDSCLSC